MIVRLWRGWTAPENAESYETLLKAQIFPGILGRSIAGFEGIRARPRDRSPDRLDALVWALWELMVKKEAEPRVRGI